MPPRKTTRTRKTYKKRYYRKRKSNIVSINRVFPQEMTVKMVYCAYKNIQPAGGGGIAYYSFWANGIFDPDAAAGGHQPLGHDQWATFYQHYRVLASKITVTYLGQNEGGNYPANVVGTLLAADDVVNAASWVTLSEQPTCNWLVLQGVPGHTTPMRTSTRFRSSREFAKQTSNVEFGVSPNADQQQAWFIVWCAALDEATDTVGAKVAIRIEYTVKLSTPKELEQS